MTHYEPFKLDPSMGHTSAFVGTSLSKHGKWRWIEGADNLRKALVREMTVKHEDGYKSTGNLRTLLCRLQREPLSAVCVDVRAVRKNGQRVCKVIPSWEGDTDAGTLEEARDIAENKARRWEEACAGS